jgi:hypothetical protein
MKYIFIDIRKSDEVYSKHFDKSQEYSFYNIPMNMIRFNAETIIQHLDYVDEIYIVCESASRSEFIKHKYFHHYPKIKVSPSLQFSKLNHGPNKVSLNGKELNINVVGSNSFNFYNVMRIQQTIMGILMLLIGVYIYFQVRKEKVVAKLTAPLLLLALFGSGALYNGLTSTCTLSTVLVDYLN